MVAFLKTSRPNVLNSTLCNWQAAKVPRRRMLSIKRQPNAANGEPFILPVYSINMGDKEKLRSHCYHANAPYVVKRRFICTPAPANIKVHAAVRQKHAGGTPLKATPKIFSITYTEMHLLIRECRQVGK